MTENSTIRLHRPWVVSSADEEGMNREHQNRAGSAVRLRGRWRLKNSLSNTFSVVITATNTMADTLANGVDPQGVVVTPDHRRRSLSRSAI